MLTLAIALFAVAAPPNPPVSGSSNLVRSIEAQTVVELGSVSYDGHLGQSSVDLIALESHADALPALLTLASSPSSVARVVAAAGLAGRTDEDARSALQRLAHDTAPVDVERGCLGQRTTVAQAVAFVLRYPGMTRPGT